MRRRDREMSEEFAWSVVDQCEYAFLAMTGPDNSPYGVPITIARSGNSIYFHGAKEGQKVDCIRQHPRICLTCVGNTMIQESQFTTQYESAILIGDVTEVLDDAGKIEALRLICQRHTPSAMALFDRAAQQSLSHTAVFRIDAVEITGKCKQ